MQSKLFANIITHLARCHFRNPNLLQQVFSVLFAGVWCATAWFVIYVLGVSGFGVVLCFGLATIPYLKGGLKVLKISDEYLKSKYPF